MTSGGSGFESRDDGTIAARLSVDVPADAISNLQQVTQQAHDLRTEMEAAARAQGDFVGYLRQLPVLMREVTDANGRLGASAAGALGAPGGVRSGRNDAQSTLWDDNAPGGRDSSRGRVGDVDSAMDELQRRDPRQHGNVMAQRAYGERNVYQGGSDPLPPPRQRPSGGGGGAGSGLANRSGSSAPPRNTGSEDQPEWYERAQQYQQRGMGTAQQIMNETRAGGNTSGVEMGAHAARGAYNMGRTAQTRFDAQQAAAQQRAVEATISGDAQAARAAEAQATRAGAMSSGAGTLMRGAGIAGVVAGGAMATQSAGEWYQGLAAQGMQRGGGFQEGAAFEGQVRVMAMNPFISLEQSRKIMQSALNEGYTGKEFETVTEFMADNLKKMNVDVATSTKILQENVNKGGQSIGGAQIDLKTAQQLSADPNSRMTAARSVEQWQQGTQAAISVGAGGVEASQYGLANASIGSEDPLLAGTLGAALTSSATSNPMMQQQIAMATGYKGVPAGALAFALAQPGGAQKAQQAQIDLMTRLAQRFLPLLNNPHTAQGAVSAYMEILDKAYGVKLDQPTAQAVLKQIQNGTFKDLPGAAKEAQDEAATGGDLESPSGMDRTKEAARGAGGFLQQMTGGLVDALGEVAALGGDSPVTRWGESIYGAGERRQERGGALSGAASTNSRIRELVNEYDLGSIGLKGESGKEFTLDRNALSDEGIMQDIVSGKTQIKLPGSSSYTSLADSSHQQTDGAVNGSGGGTFDLTPDARRLLNLIPTDPRNQQQQSADSGQDGARRNDPQAGQNYGN